MASAVLTTGAAYGVRIIVRDGSRYRSRGPVSVGVGDRRDVRRVHPAGDGQRLLSAADRRRATNTTECNRLVNEQAQIGLLLAGPGVIWPR